MNVLKTNNVNINTVENLSNEGGRIKLRTLNKSSKGDLELANMRGVTCVGVRGRAGGQQGGAGAVLALLRGDLAVLTVDLNTICLTVPSSHSFW